MPPIKSIADITKKFVDVTPGRAAQYAEGCASPSKDWATATEAAETNYEEGVQAGIGRKAFGKGVKEAGTSKLQEGIKKKGVSRWPVGVRLAAAAFSKGFGPFRDAIERVRLPERYKKRDPRNLDRVAAICKELGDLKEQQA